jgi:putative tryptophan/tyrosine transport system substrate-binding protein
MRRREFITLLGGAAAACPLAARAQQAERARRIGAIMGSTGTGRSDIAAFQQALQQLGWIDGRNVRIDYRFGLGNAADIRRHTAELVALAPDVILVGGEPVLASLLQATRSLPIVFVAVVDPVGAGFVESLSRPGGNATGFIQFEYSLSGKWLQLLKEIAPSVARAAVLRDAATTSGAGQFAVIQSVATSVGVEVSPINVMLARSSAALLPSRALRMPVWSWQRAPGGSFTAIRSSGWRPASECPWCTFDETSSIPAA